MSATRKVAERSFVPGCFHFVCLAWAGGVFVVYAIVNDVAFHRDPGIGDVFTARCPMDISSIGSTCLIKGPSTIPKHREGQASSAIVRILFLRRERFRSQDHTFLPVLAGNTHRTTVKTGAACFITSSILEPAIEQDSLPMTASARRRLNFGTQPGLDNPGDVYARYRLTWFDAVAGFTMFGVPLLGALLLLRWMLRIRRASDRTVVC